MEEESGLSYIRARYYAPELGRFIAKDPQTGNDRDGQSLNRYVYALNNPIIKIDPNGENPWLIIGGAVVGAIGGVVGTAIGDVSRSIEAGKFEHSSWEEYAVSALGGAAGGATEGLCLSLATTCGIAAGAVEGSVSNITTQGLEYLAGKRSKIDFGSLIWDTALSAGLSGISFGDSVISRPPGRPAINPVTKYISGKNIFYYYAKDFTNTALEEFIKYFFTPRDAQASNSPFIPEIYEANTYKKKIYKK
jgi:RHS repeat-associated protein